MIMVSPIQVEIGSAPVISTAFDPRTISECDAFALAQEITNNINLQLETLQGEPYNDMLVQKIDYYVGAVKSYYTSIGLYPLPFQYEVPIKIELKLDAGTHVIDKTYELESMFKSKREIMDKELGEKLMTLKFKSDRQLDYEYRHGIKD